MKGRFLCEEDFCEWIFEGFLSVFGDFLVKKKILKFSLYLENLFRDNEKKLKIKTKTQRKNVKNKKRTKNKKKM